mgnify:CR=1 FL=1
MTVKKYEFVEGDTKVVAGRTLHRIRALVAIASMGVAAGDLGGYIESERNLSQVSGDAWVYGNAQVYGDACVYKRNHLGWLSCVGSENGTLCWFLQKDRTVAVRRGCFSGSLDDFRAAIEETHGDSPHGQQYRLLIQFIELRAAEALRDFAPAVATEMEAA